MTTFTFAESAFVPLAVGFFGLVAAAATSGIASSNVPYFKGDEAGLKREAAASRKLGMTGKAALHAEQLGTINNIFSPSGSCDARPCSYRRGEGERQRHACVKWPRY